VLHKAAIPNSTVILSVANGSLTITTKEMPPHPKVRGQIPNNL